MGRDTADVAKLRFSILRRVFLALVIALIPSYIVVLIINWFTLEQVQSMTTDSVRAEADRYMQELDESLSEILSFQREHIASADFYELAIRGGKMDNQTRTDIILNMQARLTIARSSSRRIEDVFILVPALGSTIGSSSYWSLLDMEEFAVLSDYSNFFGYNMLLRGGKLLICLPLPDLISSKEPPLYATKVVLDSARLLDELGELEAYAGSSVILLNSEGQIVTASTRDPRLLEDSVTRMADESVGGRITLDGAGYYLGVHRSEGMDMCLVTYTPGIGIDRMLAKYNLYFALAIIIVITTIIAFTYWEYITLYKPLHMLLNAFANTGTRQFEGIPHKPDDPFYYIYDRYNEMNDKLRELVEEVLEKRIQWQHAELGQLQSQINPHMLYNSFFTLYQMAKLNDMENIMRFSRSLSQYYRLLTRIDSPDVTLREEIENAKLYVQINDILHYNTVVTEFGELPGELGRLVVPKLIMQPLIENAYKHAKLSEREGSRVRIGFTLKWGLLRVSVCDNGAGITPERLRRLKDALCSEGGRTGGISGLVNVNRRLQIQYGARFGLRVRGGRGPGFEVAFILPSTENEEGGV